MYVCMCVCMKVCMFVRVSMYWSVFLCVRMCACLCVRLIKFVCLYACLYLCCGCGCINVCAFAACCFGGLASWGRADLLAVLVGHEVCVCVCVNSLQLVRRQEEAQETRGGSQPSAEVVGR